MHSCTSIPPAMHDSLSKFPLSLDAQRLVHSDLWKDCRPHPIAEQQNLNSAYFEYYTTQCQRFIRDGSIHVLLKRHSEIVDIAKLILLDSTWDQIRSHVLVNYAPNNGSSNHEAVSTTIDLCASLLLMAQIGTHKYGISGWSPLSWASKQTLRQALQQHFRLQKVLTPDNQRIASIFTAREIQHISGIQIKWTENIVDHLLLTDDDQTVFIFSCVSFLRYQQRCVHTTVNPFLVLLTQTLLLHESPAPR